MSDSVDASVLYDAPLFTVNIAPGVAYMRIPEFAVLLANAIHPRMAGELTIKDAMAADVAQREEQKLQLEKDPSAVPTSGPFQDKDAPSLEDVALRRECTRIFHELGMQMDVRRSRMRILSPVTFAPMAVRYMQNPPSQSSLNKAMVPTCDLMKYAGRFLVQVKIVSRANAGQSLPKSALEDAGDQEKALDVLGIRQEALRQLENQKGNSFLRLPDVIERTGLPKASIYAMMKRGDFPGSTSLGGRKVGWSEVAIQDWINRRLSSASGRD